jgi:hypothetical protein
MSTSLSTSTAFAAAELLLYARVRIVDGVGLWVWVCVIDTTARTVQSVSIVVGSESEGIASFAVPQVGNRGLLRWRSR